MSEGLLDLLSTTAAVGLVGLAAVGFLSRHLLRQELGSGQEVSATAQRHRAYGTVLTIAFVALVVLRFAVLGA